MKLLPLCAAFSAALFVNANAADDSKTDGAAAAPETKNCLHLTRVRHTKVLDDQNILFYMRNGDIWKNTLPHKCHGLGFEKSFSYKTSLNQLCNVDIITVLRLPHGPNAPSCGLGKFVEYEEPKEDEDDASFVGNG